MSFSIKYYRLFLSVLCCAALFSVFACASDPYSDPREITQSKDNPLIKDFEYEQFSGLQLQSIRENAEYSFLSYMGGFSDINYQNLAILAIKSQQLDLLSNLIKNKIDLNQQDGNGWTALMYAVLYPNSSRSLKILVKDGGADLNIQNNDGKTALMLALEYNAKTDNIEFLLENMADFSLKDNKGWTAWDYAQDNPNIIYTNLSVNLVSSTRQQFFELLKVPGIENVETLNYSEFGSDTRYKNDETPLMWVAKYNANPVAALKEFAPISDLNAVDKNGNNVAHYAMQNSAISKLKIESLRVLKELGAPINTSNNTNETPFLTAIHYGASSDLVSAFFDEVALDENNNNILRALFYASEFNTDTSVHSTLVSKGIDVNNVDENGRNVVYYLGVGTNISNTNIFSYYKKLGVDFRKVDKQGNPALYYLVKNISSAKILDIVLRGNAKFAEKSYLLQSNKDGMTLMHVAAKFNSNFDVAKYITDSSDSVILRAKDTSDYTPLHYALMDNKNTKIAKYIFDKTPELLRAHTMKNETLLMAAAKNPHTFENVELILDALARNDWEEKENVVNAKDYLGNTALHYAMQFSSNSKAIDLLVKNGADINAGNKEGQTPLMLAAFNTNSPAAFRYLISLPDIIIEATDNYEQSAFVYAAENSIFPEYINLFYQYQANDEIQNTQGESAKMLMQENMYLAPFVELVE